MEAKRKQLIILLFKNMKTMKCKYRDENIYKTGDEVNRLFFLNFRIAVVSF
jgi:hypothetical protein